MSTTALNTPANTVIANTESSVVSHLEGVDFLVSKVSSNKDVWFNLSAERKLHYLGEKLIIGTNKSETYSQLQRHRGNALFDHVHWRRRRPKIG